MFWDAFECWAVNVAAREVSIRKVNISLDHNAPNIYRWHLTSHLTSSTLPTPPSTPPSAAHPRHVRHHGDEVMLGIVYYLLTKVTSPSPALLESNPKEYARQLRHGGGKTLWAVLKYRSCPALGRRTCTRAQVPSCTASLRLFVYNPPCLY